MKSVRITAIRKTCYPDLMAQYENPMEHACDVEEGMVWISETASVRKDSAPAPGRAWSSS